MTWEDFFDAIEGNLYDVINVLNGLADGAINRDEAAESLSHIELPSEGADEPF